jgi:hypothetical protein
MSTTEPRAQMAAVVERGPSAVPFAAAFVIDDAGREVLLAIDKSKLPTTVLGDSEAMVFELRPMRCRVCGCTERNACTGGCEWVEMDLCSRCGGGSGLVDANGARIVSSRAEVAVARAAEEAREAAKRDILQRAQDEVRSRGGVVALELDLAVASAIVGYCQLALRHPEAASWSAATLVRQTIDGLIAAMESQGLRASAELARLGDNPAFDL